MSETPKPSWEQAGLFPEPSPVPVQPTVKPITTPVWSESKARLVARYLYLFVQVTHHGNYIDGFAGPQHPERPETWTARLVLDVDLLQRFHLFEIDRAKQRLLRELCDEHPGRNVILHPVDFNEGVSDILKQEVLPPTQAAFALIDQHTFECQWRTLERLADYKRATQYKIELFYFLAYGWLDRALAATDDTSRIDAWWGNRDWDVLRRVHGIERAWLFARRLRDELGYLSAIPWAIHSREESGRIMYFMVHATDHPEAPKLMWRAANEVAPRAIMGEQMRMTDD